MEKNFYVYMLRCADDTIYTGYCVDIINRLKQHSIGKASKYTRARLPVELVYIKRLETKSEAMKEEIRIKKLGRIKKLQLIEEYDNSIEKNKFL